MGGDGGSPLVCPPKTIPNRYVQAGIVAWGIGCGEQGTPGVYGDVAKGVCFIDHVMSCNGVGAGASTNTYLGFSQSQCGRWFQDSLPDNLPDRAKEGAAQQFLGSQCTVNYLPDSNIGDEFGRHEGQPQGDGYVDPQTNQAQTNNDGYVDPLTNQAQTNNDGYVDPQTNQAQVNNDGYNGQDPRASSQGKYKRSAASDEENNNDDDITEDGDDEHAEETSHEE